MAKKNITKKKKITRVVGKGVVHISATFNNTLVTITDEVGAVIAWSSAGSLGFKGSKKSTPFAAQQTVVNAFEKATSYGLKEVGIRIQGPGYGRETAVKTVGTIENIRVKWLKDVTPLPHNGCRPPKRRRG